MLQPSVRFKKVGPRKPPRPLWKSYLQACGLAFFVALILRAFVVQAYRIPTASMEDTILPGDFVLVNKLAYRGGKQPELNDVIVFAYPLNPQRDYVKRIVATGGQEVAMRNKQLFVNGTPVALPPLGKNSTLDTLKPVFSNRDNFGPVVVPQGSFFVLGDNRDQSDDSRFWGTVPRDHVRGRVMFVYWSWAPAADAPGWKFPYVTSLLQMLWYNTANLSSRLRIQRIGQAIR